MAKNKNIFYQLGDRVIANVNGKKVRGEFLEGNKKKCIIYTNNGDELEVRTKNLNLAI